MPLSIPTVPGSDAGAISFQRGFNRLMARITTPQFVISVALTGSLAYLVLLPLVQLFIQTVTWGEGDRRFSRDAEPGELTNFHWREVFNSTNSEAMFLEPLWNTLVTGITAAILAMTLGSMLAWLVTRTDMPGKTWLRPFFTLSYVIPSFALALAWEAVFKSPKFGGQPGLMQALLGVQPPEWISFGPFPIIVTMAIHYYPFAFLLVMGTLATIDSQLEESAELLGASRLTILRRITFPIIAPALLAAFILTFGKTIGTFALPYLLGGPAQYHTLSTMLYAQLGYGLDSMGYILALVLIAITALAIYISSRLLGGNLQRFETIGGKGFKGKLTSLGPWRWPISALAAAIALVTAVIPIVLLAYQTMMAVDGRWGLDNLTLHYWIGESHPDFAFGEPGVLHNRVILGATWNTLKLAFISSVLCSVLGLVIGYIVVRNRESWVSRLMDQLAFVPFLFPSIAFGAMYLTMFAEAQGPIPALYGTFTLLVLISVVNRLPYSTRTGASAVTQIGRELEEAAAVQGASWLRSFIRIVLPLTTSGVVAGMMVSFVGIMRELTLIILLITPATAVLMTVGFRYVQEDQTQLGNALVLLVTLLTIAGELIMWRLGKGWLARIHERQTK